MAIDASFGGSHQDSTVFELSNIGQRILNQNLLGDYYLIGDNGFVLLQYLAYYRNASNNKSYIVCTIFSDMYMYFVLKYTCFEYPTSKI